MQPDRFAGATNTHAALVYGSDYDQDEAQIGNCTFEGGSYGVYLGSSGAGERGADSAIRQSRFEDQGVAGIHTNHTSVLIEEDTVSSSRVNFVGVHIDGAYTRMLPCRTQFHTPFCP